MSHAPISTATASAHRSTLSAMCDRLAGVLSSSCRQEIVDAAFRDGDFGAALVRLRSAMCAHAFRTDGGSLDLGEDVARLDAATRRDGFHVFLEWHEVAYRFIEEDIPVVLLDYVSSLGDFEGAERHVLTVLLDYYFLYVLALCATRVWDAGDPAADLDRVTELLRALQKGPGSGRRFVDDAETLLWIAISTYEPDDLAYRRLLDRVLALAPARRLRVARVGAPLLGCHLRWGFPQLYERDLWRMRADNFIDYPWLLASITELSGEYARVVESGGPEAERRSVAGALLNGLTPDPEAFVGEPPASLAPYRTEHDRTRALLHRHRAALLGDFAGHAPEEGVYSPLGFHFNFPHNAVFAMALLAALGDDMPNASLNALLTGEGGAGADASAVGALADRLTAFAAANPEPRGSRSVLGLYYDPAAAARAFHDTCDTLARAGATGR